MRFHIGCLPLESPALAEDAIARLARRTPGLRVVVLPQFDLANTAALDAFAGAAKSQGLYLACAARIDGALCGYLFNPTGQIILHQHSISEGQGEAKVHVASTPIGEFACLVGEDVAFAEYVRLAVFKGAEVILNPTAEFADDRALARGLLRGARSWENFVVLATTGLAGDGDGVVDIRNYSGETLITAKREAAAVAVDVASLRKRRSEPWINYPAQLRSQLYAGFYERAIHGRRDAPATSDGPIYDVLMMQIHEKFVTGLETRDQVIGENIDTCLGLARMFAMRPTTRLVIFPEFFLQGSTPGTLEYWEKAGIRVPGPETDRLAKFAQECNVFLCGAVLEFDPDWPRRYFNTSFIISPKGEIILKYRKIQCADLQGLLNVTTPGNVYSSYVQSYGEEALIPVVDTEIGRLGTAICFDSNWPELWRVMALKGAEVICNPTSEIHSDRVPYWWAAKRAHAAENVYYVACANAGSEQFHPSRPVTAMNRGHSSLIDFHGRLAAHADGPGIIPLVGRVDLGALRRARTSRAENALARFRPEAVAKAYRDYPGFPNDCFLDKPMEKGAEGPALVVQQIKRLQAMGVYKTP